MVPSPRAPVQMGELRGQGLRCDACGWPSGWGRSAQPSQPLSCPLPRLLLVGWAGCPTRSPGSLPFRPPGARGAGLAPPADLTPRAGSPGEETGDWPPGRPPRPGGVSELLRSQVGKGEKGSPGATVT